MKIEFCDPKNRLPIETRQEVLYPLTLEKIPRRGG